LGQQDKTAGATANPRKFSIYQDGMQGYDSSYGAPETFRNRFQSGFYDGYQDGYANRTRALPEAVAPASAAPVAPSAPEAPVAPEAGSASMPTTLAGGAGQRLPRGVQHRAVGRQLERGLQCHRQPRVQGCAGGIQHGAGRQRGVSDGVSDRFPPGLRRRLQPSSV